MPLRTKGTCHCFGHLPTFPDMPTISQLCPAQPLLTANAKSKSPALQFGDALHRVRTITAVARRSNAAWCTRHDHDPEEAELGLAQNRARPAFEWRRSDGLYPLYQSPGEHSIVMLRGTKDLPVIALPASCVRV